MPPFIMKMKFYKPGAEAGLKNAANARYIATRPGADRGEIEFDPDSAPGHVKYASERPGSHGLFGPDETPPGLEGVQSELKQHNGLVWRAVVSLREDDAVRLGYTERASWENALRSAIPEAAEKMGIQERNLRWVAAYHAEGGHPHCHIIMWERNPMRSRGVLSQVERKDVKKCFVRRIYENERLRLGVEKTAIRDLIRDVAKDETTRAKEILRDVRNYKTDIRAMEGTSPGLPPRLDDESRKELASRLKEISKIMPVQGRIALKYMPDEVKEKAREAADWILRQPGFSVSNKRYSDIAREMAGHYTGDNESVNRAGNKAYDDLRDRVAQAVLKGAGTLSKDSREINFVSSDKITNTVWRSAWRSIELERTKAEYQREIEKQQYERQEKARKSRYETDNDDRR